MGSAKQACWLGEKWKRLTVFGKLPYVQTRSLVNIASHFHCYNASCYIRVYMLGCCTHFTSYAISLLVPIYLQSTLSSVKQSEPKKISANIGPLPNCSCVQQFEQKKFGKHCAAFPLYYTNASLTESKIRDLCGTSGWRRNGLAFPVMEQTLRMYIGHLSVRNHNTSEGVRCPDRERVRVRVPFCRGNLVSLPLPFTHSFRVKWGKATMCSCFQTLQDLSCILHTYRKLFICCIHMYSIYLCTQIQCLNNISVNWTATPLHI